MLPESEIGIEVGLRLMQEAEGLLLEQSFVMCIAPAKVLEAPLATEVAQRYDMVLLLGGARGKAIC
jgi:hypothetical protein